MPAYRITRVQTAFASCALAVIWPTLTSAATSAGLIVGPATEFQFVALEQGVEVKISLQALPHSSVQGELTVWDAQGNLVARSKGTAGSVTLVPPSSGEFTVAVAGMGTPQLLVEPQSH